jgi:hypothetical protein
MMSHQDRGALLDASECFYHLLLFAVRIVPCPVEASLKSSCRGSHRWGSFDRISHRRQARGNASMFA